MSNNNIDKIAWELMDVAKETTKKNFVVAVNTGQLKLNPEVLPVIMTLIDSSINEGFSKGHKNFTNRVKVASTSTAVASGDTDSSASLKKRK
jgi:hypothetical protein